MAHVATILHRAFRDAIRWQALLRKADTVVLTGRAQKSYARLVKQTAAPPGVLTGECEGDDHSEDSGLRMLLRCALNEGELTHEPSAVFEVTYLSRR